MEMGLEIDYRQKYLKYKAKYLELKKQMGGLLLNCKKCKNCSNFTHATYDVKKFTKGDLKCSTCSHMYKNHLPPGVNHDL